MNLINFYKRFPNEQACRDFLEQARWGDNPKCPKCGAKKVYKFKSGRYAGRRWKCSSCRKQFTVRIGTIFEESPVSLQKWFLTIYLATSLKKGISSVQLAKYIEVTQKTAWFMLQRIRHALSNEDPKSPMGGDVEIDETYIGGKNKNKHANKKIKRSQGKSLEGKTPVFGMLHRGLEVRTKVVGNTSSATLTPLVRKNVEIGGKVYSDENVAYNSLQDDGYRHKSVSHARGQYVHMDTHTNGIEGFWSQLKRGVVGIYHQVSPKHLQKYCDEFAYRYNTRWMTDGQRFEHWLAHLCGGRLEYRDLILAV